MGRDVDSAPRARPRFRPINVLDAPWLAMDTRRHPMHVAGLIICRAADGAAPDFVASLVQTMKRNKALTDPFDRRLSMRGWGRMWPRWESVDHVNLDEHVRVVALPAPGGDRELNLLVADLHRTQLDRARPLWDITFIDGLDQNRFAIYARFHHSLVDGVGAIRVLEAAFSPDSDRRGMPPIWAYSSARRRPPRPRRQRREAVVATPGVVASAVRALRDDERAKPYTAPRSVLNTSISSERRVITVSWEIARLQAVAAAAGGTINDALLTICGTALRRYLSDAGALPDQSLVATVPVSVRPVDGDHLGNAISFTFVPLATEIADPWERSARITASTGQVKTQLGRLSKAAVDTFSVMTMARFIATQIIGLGARTRPMFNVAISNVPGPRAPLYYDGLQVLAIHPVSVLQSGQPLNITALSYAGHLNVTFTACATSLPTVPKLAAYCTDALELLESVSPHAPEPLVTWTS